MKAVRKNPDSYSSKNEKFILLCDFNFEPTEYAMKEFIEVENIKHLVKGPNCFKNSDKPSCSIQVKVFRQTRLLRLAYLIFAKW